MGQMTASGTVDPLPGLGIKECQALLEVERGRDTFEREPQLNHREGDFGLNADDDGFRAAEPRHVRDVAQRPDGEGVHDVERRHVHDDAPGAKFSHAGDQRLTQLRQIGVGQRGLDRRDQIGTLLRDRDFHRSFSFGSGQDAAAVSDNGSTLYPISRSASSMPPCRSPTVAISERSTPMVTSVCAISGDRPVTMTVAPSKRAASTVWTRLFATLASIAATPVMSMTTTFARLVRMARSSCSVNWRARCGSMTPMIGRMRSRSRTWSTGVDSSRIASCCCRMTRSRSCTKPTATVFAIRFAAGSYASRIRFSLVKSS